MARSTLPVSHRPRVAPRYGGVLLAAGLALGLGAMGSCAQAPVPVPAPAATGKSAKRAGPDGVAPVRVGDTVYEAIHWGRARGLAHNGGYVRAFDAATGRELWVLEVYRVDYDPRREQDVQDVFIDALRAGASGRTLEVGDEAGRHYEVDLQSRTVRLL